MTDSILRHAARVLLLDPAGRVLLVRFFNPETGFTWWAPPGGGIAAGETPEEAARREVFEETGLREFSLGPCVWRHEIGFTWRGRRYRQRERIYVARVDAFEPSRDGLLPEEVELLAEHRWWTVEAIEASPERFGPRGLAGLLRSLLAEG